MDYRVKCSNGMPGTSCVSSTADVICKSPPLFLYGSCMKESFSFLLAGIYHYWHTSRVFISTYTHIVVRSKRTRNKLCWQRHVSFVFQVRCSLACTVYAFCVLFYFVCITKRFILACVHIRISNVMK